MKKLVRVTTVPLSLEKLLNGQWNFLKDYYDITAVSSNNEKLKKFGKDFNVKTFCVPLTRKITPLQDLKSIWLLYKFFKKEKPDIVHTQTPKAGLVGMFAAFLTTPFDVIKTRRQVTQGAETRTARLLLDIVQSEGLPALFSGVVPRVIKVAPACGILIGTYHYVQEAVAVAGQSRQM